MAARMAHGISLIFRQGPGGRLLDRVPQASPGRPRGALWRARYLLVIHAALHLFREQAVDQLVPLDGPQAGKFLTPHRITSQHAPKSHDEARACRPLGQHMAVARGNATARDALCDMQ